MFYNYMLNIARKNALLQIFAGSSPDAKTANEIPFTVNGYIGSVAASTIPVSTETYIDPVSNTEKTRALTIENGKHCILSVYADMARNFYIEKGVEKTALDANNVLIPLHSSDFPQSLQMDKALIGAIYLLNLTGSQFAGGTTALDASGITAIFIDCTSSVGQ